MRYALTYSPLSHGIPILKLYINETHSFINETNSYINTSSLTHEGTVFTIIKIRISASFSWIRASEPRLWTPSKNKTYL